MITDRRIIAVPTMNDPHTVATVAPDRLAAHPDSTVYWRNQLRPVQGVKPDSMKQHLVSTDGSYHIYLLQALRGSDKINFWTSAPTKDSAIRLALRQFWNGDIANGNYTASPEIAEQPNLAAKRNSVPNEARSEITPSNASMDGKTVEFQAADGFVSHCACCGASAKTRKLLTREIWLHQPYFVGKLLLFEMGAFIITATLFGGLAALSAWLGLDDLSILLPIPLVVGPFVAAYVGFRIGLAVLMDGTPPAVKLAYCQKCRWRRRLQIVLAAIALWVATLGLGSVILLAMLHIVSSYDETWFYRRLVNIRVVDEANGTLRLTFRP